MHLPKRSVLFVSNVATTIWPLNRTPVSSSYFDLGSGGGIAPYFQLVNCRSVYLPASSQPNPANRTHTRQLNPSRLGRVSGFHSDHPGGANFLMADGSVVFISESIDIATYRSLSSIDGGETATTE